MRFIAIALAAPILISNLAFASYDEDCSELARRSRVPAQELQAYKQWCISFEESCYKIEDAAAQACGERGAAESAGAGAIEAGRAQVAEGQGSYSEAGNQGLGVCAQSASVRERQKAECAHYSRQCDERQATFRQSSLPQKPVLQCSTFSPESRKWSAQAAAAPSMCRAIRAELSRVTSLAARESQQCGSLAGIVKKTGDQASQQEVNDRVRLSYPDARACGIYGCAQNEDGTYSPKRAPASAISGGQEASYGNSGPGPAANTSIRMNSPDPRACGMFGCQQNEDGTYSPKYAPGN